ncbi:D-glutamate cyclase, mitochondrial isoform X2 [Chaetodon trifascialis]|uniref:D-glutamate cyclase, mitochondrial isoform X2 n=1 Tax=Chaetodon trifascialis TaxID=109706 RepID=UPI00399181E4
MVTAVRAARCSLTYFRGICNSATGPGNLDHLNTLNPAELRLLIRQEDPRIRTTTGLAKGYQQANVVILPNHLANDFEAFCRNNPAPLPLLYRSQSGETSCVPLAEHADIRTDISQYCVYEEGCLVKTVSSLQSYSAQPRIASELQAAHHGPWSDMVCFYLGCSFGFEGRLKNAGVPVRNLEQGTNVSMYRTAVPCTPLGVFSCPLVVTMRPVPAGLLNAAVEVTHLNPLAHGAPVHIGDPALLGIHDLSKTDYGDPVDLQPGDVTVFWACGVTAIEAILNSKPTLAFSHSPGCMFLTDIPDSSSSSPIPLPSDRSIMDPSMELIPLCFLVSHDPLLYSLASQRAVAKIRHLERIIGEDPGVLKSAIPLVTFEDRGPDSALHFLCHHGDPSKPRYDHLVAIERSGRAEDGNYYNMRGVNVKYLVDPIDNLFIAAKGVPGITTTGIGDGGNELGMGKLKEKVKAQMPNGSLIACDVPADYAITAGVSNWGGYAVACGLYLLHTCPTHQRYLKKGLGLECTTPQEQLQDWTANLPSVDKEEYILSTLMSFGIRSGKTRHLAMEVDGLTFHPTHSDIITRLLEVTLYSTAPNP